MASSESFNRSNQVGCSKSHMSLMKIINFISSCKESEDGSDVGKAKIEIDLNLRLGTSEESERGYSACSAVGGVGEAGGEICEITGKCCSSVMVVGEKSSEGECDETVRREEREEVVVVGETESETEREKQQEMKLPRRKEGYMDALFAAAMKLLGDTEEQDEEEKIKKNYRGKRGKELEEQAGRKVRRETEPNSDEAVVAESKRNGTWMLEFYQDLEEDVSPVVRSRRGRNQVLPSKYRDSVLEPWRSVSRPRPKSSSSKPRNRKLTGQVM